LATGVNHACAVKDDGLYCWGANASGQLGLGDKSGKTTPQKINSLPVAAAEIKQISAGLSHTCLLSQAGAVYCWGDNALGQLNLVGVTEVLIPTAAPQLSSGVSSISSGYSHNCAILPGTGAKCWGWNLFYQLGNNLTANSADPIEVLPVAFEPKQLVAGHFFTLSIGYNGTMKVWGSGAGVLPTTTVMTMPVDYIY
jgi:alpha-tubulin suppressor-like RCC1 family protein